MAKTRLYNIQQVVETKRFMIALADSMLFVKGYIDQWVPIPLPFDCSDEYSDGPRSISTSEDSLIMVTRHGCIYRVDGMYLQDIGYKVGVNNKDWVKHWKRIPTGIRQKEE